MSLRGIEDIGKIRRGLLQVQNIQCRAINYRENRALYSLAAANHWRMFSPDKAQAFTHGKLDVTVRIMTP